MIDHDRLFKELIQTFFWEFIELFLPEVLEYVAQDKLTFLTEEIFTDVTTGDKRRIDLLAQVKWREENSYFLIHLENQAYSQKEFERRMFHYFARLDAKYLMPIFPIVIFSYDEPRRPQKSQYAVHFPHRRILEFNYFAIQLNNLNWRNFLNQPNPVAAALMAKMDFKPEEKIKVKLECLRMLVTLKLNPAKIELISGFIDTYLRLNTTEEQEFNTELHQANLFEEEQIMKIVTSWMEQGIEQGEQKVIKILLKQRFNYIDPTLESRIDGLSSKQIENLASVIFDLQSLEDLIKWLDQQN
ncbi:Rpn family recombination-promoting nuclease/putative transposase [Nostoc sp.]|uniref:Rpn family recombination-promoting nuclease/putative transposase n=1 Tax=Nostoc sp. TaxID=1180 RepID=UPI0035937A41